MSTTLSQPLDRSTQRSRLRLPAARRGVWVVSVLSGLACAMPALAQDQDATPPAAPAATAENAHGDLFEQIWSATKGGKVHLNNRTRFEAVDQDGADDASAFTNRLRLGYTTDEWRGYSAMAEFESNVTPFPNEYNGVIQGDSSRAVVADPRGTELNQAYVNYASDAWDLNWRFGRQRINLDNQRFVGAVGWRQMEQTFDAVKFDSGLGIENVQASYTYVWGVQRIFGPDGTNFRSDAHLGNVSYTFNEMLKATGFIYMLDFENSAANSTQTYGLRLSGSYDIGEDLKLKYNGTFASQQDYANNNTDYEANYVDLNASVTKEGLGTAGIGYELLGSDEGVTAFRTPLATGHAFNGWADAFLATPANGLQDISAFVATDLPWEVKGKLVYHKFIEDEDGDDLGQELDLVLSKKINANWSVTAKAAIFDGDNGMKDRTKLWLQTTLTF